MSIHSALISERFVAFAISFITLLFTQICRHWNSNELPFAVKQQQIKNVMAKLSFSLHFKWNAFLSCRHCCCGWIKIFMSTVEKKTPLFSEQFSTLMHGTMLKTESFPRIAFTDRDGKKSSTYWNLIKSIQCFWSSVYGKMSLKSIPLPCMHKPKSSWFFSLDAF